MCWNMVKFSLPVKKGFFVVRFFAFRAAEEPL